MKTGSQGAGLRTGHLPRLLLGAFLGMVLWIYKWFRPDGAISAEDLSKV